MHASHVHIRVGNRDTSCLFAFQIDLDVLLGRTAPAGYCSPFRTRIFQDTAEDDASLLEVSVSLLSPCSLIAFPVRSTEHGPRE
jgi:hypothetical protein